jgi:hypothetical protein
MGPDYNTVQYNQQEIDPVNGAISSGNKVMYIPVGSRVHNVSEWALLLILVFCLGSRTIRSGNDRAARMYYFNVLPLDRSICFDRDSNI